MRKRKPGSPLARWILLLVAFVMLLLSAAMALPGLWLAALGGSFYYLIAGAGGIWACFTILRGRYVAGVGWFALVTLGTILWALWEIDRKAWMHAWGFDLAGRVGLHIAVLLIMLVPLSFIRERRGGRSDHGMAALILGIPLVLIGIGMGLTVFLRGLEDAPQQVAEVPVPPSAELPQRDTAGIGRSGLKRGPEEWVPLAVTTLASASPRLRISRRRTYPVLSSSGNFAPGMRRLPTACITRSRIRH